MNKYTRLFHLMIILLTCTWMTTSCSKPYDLDTPCPDYGKTCSQALINNDSIY